MAEQAQSVPMGRNDHCHPFYPRSVPPEYRCNQKILVAHWICSSNFAFIILNQQLWQLQPVQKPRLSNYTIPNVKRYHPLTSRARRSYFIFSLLHLPGFVPNKYATTVMTWPFITISTRS